MQPLAHRLLPVLLHRLANQTQLLTGLNAVLEMGGGDEILSQRAADLARAGDVTQDAGYVMAVVGSALGHDLLLARRDPRGIERVTALVIEWLAREGQTIDHDPSTAPNLRPDALDGWQVPWACAVALATGVQAGATSARWTISGGGASLQLPCGWREADTAEIMQVASGAEASSMHGQSTLHLPAAWIR